MPDRKYALEGRVAQVLSERRLVINIGGDNGVAHGMGFVALANTPLVIRDPETGSILDSFEQEKARVEVVAVRPRVAICETPTRTVPIFGTLTTLDREEQNRLAVRESDLPRLPANESYVQVGDRVREVDKSPAPREPHVSKSAPRSMPPGTEPTEVELGQLASAHALFAQRGISPGPNGYDEATLVRVIAENELVHKVVGEAGRWTAEIERVRGPAQSSIYAAPDYWDREVALAIALKMALLD